MNAFAVTALSPLDGRYANKLHALQLLMSEHGFMQRRVQVEVAWFIALSDVGMVEFPPLSSAARAHLQHLVQTFSPDDSMAIKAIERTTNHDVKAVEYWLKDQCQLLSLSAALREELGRANEFIHFAGEMDEFIGTA